MDNFVKSIDKCENLVKCPYLLHKVNIYKYISFQKNTQLNPYKYIYLLSKTASVGDFNVYWG